ncbi:MAG TPA: pyridoxal-dependent decarboxylase [Polyangiaceae bacterium]|nr:pyridoxal-dependent decarboxylase [Polyangiaceae bacterium]
MTEGRVVLDAAARAGLWAKLGALLEAASAGGAGPLAPKLDEAALAGALARFDFERPMAPVAALEAAFEAMGAFDVKTSDPRYFGLFAPAPATMAVAADALASALNPQLAAFAHAPFAVGLERSLVRAFAARFGWGGGGVEGALTGGGAEATLTALGAALGAKFPAWRRRGLRSLARDPTLYASVESHPSLVKAARVAGLGDEAVRRVPVDRGFRMKPAALAEAIANDRLAGREPFLVVATAGTTSAGAIDPLGATAEVAERFGCWLHVDAAWGGLAAFAPALAPALAGVERADSIAFDPHKALSAPLGVGAYLSRREGALRGAFEARAGYMPRRSERDPYAHSLAWSRRFLGLRVALPLAVAGFRGYAEAIEGQAALAASLRRRLEAEGWVVVNDTPLPLVCFVDGTRPDGRTARFLAAASARARASHGVWVSLVRLASGARALRACVNNVRSAEGDVAALVEGLGEARRALPF